MRCISAAQRGAARVPPRPTRGQCGRARAGGLAAPRTAADPCVAEEQADTAPQLLEGYDATLAALCAEVDACGAGDALTLHTYVLESGESSRRLLSALRGAAARGATLRVSCDRSPLSALTRMYERTDTLMDALDALARDHPDRVSTPLHSRAPNHSKYLLVRRANPADANPADDVDRPMLTDVAIFGGINIGDRFQPWRDLAVRLQGAAATSALAAALSGQRAALAGISFAVNAPASFCPLAFALRAPLPGRFGVADALRAFFDDTSLRSYVVAAAYVDGTGAALLERALARGARITLVAPRTPNVYTHSNAATLCRMLVRSGGGGADACGNFTVVLHPSMVHAKAAVGTRADGSQVALIGSANLKERSLTQFGELLMRAEGGAFTARLAAALQRLAAEGEEVACGGETDARGWQGALESWGQMLGVIDAPPPLALRYDPTVAALEEWCG